MAERSFDKWMDDLADRLNAKQQLPQNGGLPSTREWTPEASDTVIENIADQLMTVPREHVARVLALAIDRGLTFRIMPQGADFWIDIYDRLRTK